jgi:hypothetical protein
MIWASNADISVFLVSVPHTPLRLAILKRYVNIPPLNRIISLIF